jgi:MFS family permease
VPARRRAPLIALLAANAISMAGNIMALIALPWFVLQTTGSPAQAGITGFSLTAATVVAAFFGGAVVDRLGFRRASVIADVASGVTTALIPLLYATIGLDYWVLLVLVFAGSLLDAPGTTAREALLPELADMAGLSVERAGAALQVVDRGARMVGAPLAGVLIAWVGPSQVLWFNAATFAVSALLVYLLVPILAAPPAPAGAAPEGAGGEGAVRRYLRELREGLDFIRADRFLFAIVLFIVVTNFLDAPLLGVVYPVFVRQFYTSAVNLGLLVAAGGAGAVIGALAYGAVGHRLPRRAVFFGGFLLITVRLWVMALAPPFGVVALAALVAGFGSGPINPMLYALEIERIPVHLRGRVFGTITALAFIAIPLGVLLGGYALEAADVRLVLLGLGVLYLLNVVSFMLRPITRTMGAPA